MLNNKFLDKVIEQILSETRIIGGKIHTPFSAPTISPSFFFSRPSFSPSLSKHCKEVYSLNGQEIKYVWTKYLKGLTTLIDKKELSYE